MVFISHVAYKATASGVKWRDIRPLKIKQGVIDYHYNNSNTRNKVFFYRTRKTYCTNR